MQVHSFFHQPTSTYSHLIINTSAGCAAVVDPVLDFTYASGRTKTASADQILQCLEQHKCQLNYILETHIHADHLSAAGYLKTKTGAKTVIGNNVGEVIKVFNPIFNLPNKFNSAGSQFDILLADGDCLPLGDVDIKAVATPGHTPACLSYVVQNCMFVGDTFFSPLVGTARADFPGGDARQLYHSLQKILAMPDETMLYLCHDYPAEGCDPLAVVSVGEMKSNVHLQGGTEAEFVAVRNQRDDGLAMPVLIIPSLQINLLGGELPQPDDNGVSYLRVPLNKLGS